MTNQKKWRLAFLSGIILVIAITGWVLFAPPQLGGQATMVIVNGSSMQPTYYQDDLIIVRAADYYKTGDIVAYKNLQMGKFVIHRIIGEELDQFILQGDNNSWIDGFMPTKKEIIGKEWVRIPKFGKVISWLRKPLYLSFTASIFGGVLMINWLKEKNNKLSRRQRKSFRFQKWINADRLGQSGETYFLALGIFLILAIITGGIAYAKPVEKTIPQDHFYTHDGKFEYSAPAPAGIYDSTTIHSGSPLFLKLTCEIQVDYQYKLIGSNLDAVKGVQSLSAVISDTTGWTRTIPLNMETSFQGDTTKTQALFNICQAYDMVAALREKTGLQRSEFSLAIIPNTKVSGSINGIPINDEFSPTLNFKFNEVGFWMVSAGNTDLQNTDPLHPTAERMVRKMITAPETMAFLGMNLPVNSVRWSSSILFILSGGLLAFLMYSTEKMSKASRSTEIQLKYSPVIVDIQNQPSYQRRPLVEVETIQDLAKLAERFNSVILHDYNPDGTHTYLVQENNTIYQVTFREDIPAPKSTDLESREAELKTALVEHQFEIFYQPMIDINLQEVHGVEALLRWNHPTLGTLPPSAFIADAEATGLIHQLGEWVLETACQQLAVWDLVDSPAVNMAINVSSKQLIPQLPKLVKRVLKDYKLKPSRLQLEFSENQILDDLNNNIEILDSLKKIGVEISIDNYTGQVSIEHLARIRAQNLKFALNVIGQIKDPKMNAITIGTIAAARSLGMAIEAVGVETEEQLWFLRSHLVSSAQGYLFGKPVSADQLINSLFKLNENVVVYEKPILDM